jgi:WD40 repeat protein
VRSAAWSPDGQRLATTSEDRTARVWRADGTADPIVLLGHEAGVLSVAWSPDGQRLVTASKDRTARVWRADGTAEPVILRGHEGFVLSVAWSPDGQRLVTGSDDGTARVWTDLTPLRGSDDPRLWRATNYCPSIERRTQLLSVSEAAAQAEWQACQRRVLAARAATLEPR